MTADAYNRSEAGIASAKAELRQQLEQAYALVTAVRDRLASEANRDLTSIHLLELADEVLGNYEYINRLESSQ